MKQHAAAISKITPPDIPKVITRRRLFEMLDNTKHYRITWVSATAGSGKTTFAANYLKQCNIPCLWYQLDERDMDVPTFFYYLGLAACRALPDMRDPLSLLTSDQQANPSLFAQNYFEDLCNHLVPPFFMVFDNYQSIDPSSDFHGIFQKGLTGVSPSVHVLILSRTDPPPAFAGMLAKNEMRVIGPESLYLQVEETGAMLERETGVSPAPEWVEKLHRKTRGWAAGVILMAKYIHKEKIPPEKWETALPPVVYDYFAEEFFNSMDERIKAFLLVSAYLPVITESGIRSLTPHPNARDILLHLYQNHIFLERFSGSAITYQYHPLFRAFLLSKAGETFDLQKILSIRKNAAVQMETIGRMEDAAEIYGRINDVDALVRMIQKHAATLIAQGRLETLQTWLNAIPKEKLWKNAWLLFWMGMSFSPARAKEARICFEKAFSQFNKQKDRIGLYLSWSRIIDSIILEWDDFKNLDPWMDWFDSHGPGETDVFPVAIQARIAVCICAAWIIRKPGHPALVPWLENALDLSRKISDFTTRLKAGIWAVTYYMWIGQLDKALIFKDKADSLMQQGPAPPVALMFWQWLDLSADIRSMNAPATALARVMAMLNEADKNGAHSMDQMLFPPGVFAALVLGDFEKAKILLDRFNLIPEDTHLHGRVIFHHFKGLYCLLQGRATEAAAHAETALTTADLTGYVFYQALCRFQMAHVLHTMEMPEKARKHLKKAFDLSAQTKSQMLNFMCLLKNAHLLLSEENDKDREKGLENLSKALTLGKNLDFVVTIWWWDPDMMTALCGAALMAGIETAFVKRLIRIHQLFPKTDRMHIENWPWAVKIHALGAFRIQLEEKPLPFKGKPPKKPLELLQAIIAFGGEDIPVDWLIDALWCDAEGDVAQSAFSTTLSRLRNLLKNKDAVTTHNGKVSLHLKYCWVDVFGFNHMMDKGDAHWAMGEKKQAARCYEDALHRYSGNFLCEEPARGWNITPRERLKHRYLAAVVKLGMWLEETHQLQNAILVYEKGLSIDDLEESLYQHLMRCQLYLGRKAEAAKTYRQCQDRLSEKLGVSPSSETRAVYLQMQNK